MKVSQTQGESGQPAAILFWAAHDSSSVYMAKIATNGVYAIQRWTGGRWLYATPWQSSDAIKQGNGQTNELRVVTLGNQATLSVNGQQLVSIHGYPPADGSRFGLYAESGVQPSTWEFSEFRIFQKSGGNDSTLASTGDTIFADDFSTLDPAWGLASGNQRVEGNKLVLQAPVNGTYTTLNQGNLFNDADMRVTISQTQGDTGEPGGIAFWGVDVNSFYVAAIQSNGLFAIFRTTAGRWMFPSYWQKSDAIKQGLGQTNELRVVTQGRLATFYINGQQVAATRGFPPSGGSFVGLHAESGGTQYVWQYSDFKVLKAPAGGPSSTPADSHDFCRRLFHGRSGLGVRR